MIGRPERLHYSFAFSSSGFGLVFTLFAGLNNIIEAARFRPDPLVRAPRFENAFDIRKDVRDANFLAFSRARLLKPSANFASEKSSLSFSVSSKAVDSSMHLWTAFTKTGFFSRHSGVAVNLHEQETSSLENDNENTSVRSSKPADRNKLCSKNEVPSSEADIHRPSSHLCPSLRLCSSYWDHLIHRSEVLGGIVSIRLSQNPRKPTATSCTSHRNWPSESPIASYLITCCSDLVLEAASLGALKNHKLWENGFEWNIEGECVTATSQTPNGKPRPVAPLCVHTS